MLSHLLDTSVFCQPLKDHPVESVLERWRQLGDDAVCTAAVCLAELLQGLEARRSEKYWARYRELLQERFVALPFDAGTAAEFGRLSGELKKRGRPKPTVDLQIAATARQRGLVIATLDRGHFAGIPGVTVEDWSAG